MPASPKKATREKAPQQKSRGTPLAALAGSGFARVADASQAEGNAVRLLRDGTENFPAWLAAIAEARSTVHLENYIIEGDSIGKAFADALIAAAGRGVRCRVLYDWLGCRARTRPSFWERLRAGGVEVRCYNPARFSLPLQWISRDHRKLLCVDGQTAFTGGLCIGHDWAGNPTRNVPPWRDTAVEIRGPAVGYLEAAFADSWNTAGAAMPPGDAPQPDAIARAGDLGVWVIAGRPDSAGLYRLEQLIAQVVERSLWLADAYFVATTNYVHALTGAARAGVDVRLLVPGSNNWPVVQALSRAGYRPLLEAGVRVFEWNGPMMHAKTAVADGCWARIGSSNSNLASWISNRELDVTINDADFARQMEAMYESDLENATEIVLESGRVRGAGSVTRGRGGNRGRGVSSTGRLVAGAVGIGSAVGANISQQRILGVAESYLLLAGGISLAGLGVTLVLWPAVFAYPLGLFGGWIGITLVFRAWKLWRSRPGNKII